MVDTPRTLAAMASILPDQTSGQISPQDMRDLMQSAHPEAFGYFNIEAFGAVGDDSTDNSASLANAYSAANAAQGTMWVPDGTFLHDGLDWFTMKCEVVGASRAGAELKLRAGNSRSVITTETKGDTDFGRHGPSIRNLKITGNNESALGNYGLEMSGSKSHNVYNVSINNSGDSLIIVTDTVAVSHHNMFSDLTLVPGEHLRTLNRPLIDVQGISNGSNFRRITCRGDDTGGTHGNLGVIGGIRVFDAGGSTINTWGVFEDIEFAGFSLDAAGALVTIDSAKEIYLRNIQMSNPGTTGAGAVMYRIKRGLGTNTGGHHISARAPGDVLTGTGGTLASVVELDDDYCVIDVSHLANDTVVDIKSGAQYNDISVWGKSGVATATGAAPSVKDSSGNHDNTWRVYHGDSRGVMPPRWTTAERSDLDGGLAAADEGFFGYNMTAQKFQNWNGTVFVNTDA